MRQLQRKYTLFRRGSVCNNFPLSLVGHALFSDSHLVLHLFGIDFAFLFWLLQYLHHIKFVTSFRSLAKKGCDCEETRFSQTVRNITQFEENVWLLRFPRNWERPERMPLPLPLFKRAFH